MSDTHQAAVLAQVQSSLTEGVLAGQSNYADASTISDFVQDMEGYLTHGAAGSNYADAFLGSYQEAWTAIPTGANEAIVTFTVTNTTDLNSLVHPEVLTHGRITSIDGLAPDIIPGDPSAFQPQTQTFTWQETVEY